MCDRCALASIPGASLYEDDPGVTNCSPREDLNSSEQGPNTDTLTPPSQADDDLFRCFWKRGLHFIHVNPRSLLPKLDELRLIATRTNAVVMGVTETWLDSSVEDAEVEIQGSIIQRQDKQRSGGGVCIYVHNDIAFNPRSDLSMDSLDRDTAPKDSSNTDWCML